jgi:hypothetical protein
VLGAGLEDLVPDAEPPEDLQTSISFKTDRIALPPCCRGVALEDLNLDARRQLS